MYSLASSLLYFSLYHFSTVSCTLLSLCEFLCLKHSSPCCLFLFVLSRVAGYLQNKMQKEIPCVLLSASLTPPSIPHLLPPSTDCCCLVKVHTGPEISPLLSCSHSCTGQPTWRPITQRDNAHHKSSIGLSDTWGLSSRGNMFSSSSILSRSFCTLSHSFVPSFPLFMNRFRKRIFAFCHALLHSNPRLRLCLSLCNFSLIDFSFNQLELHFNYISVFTFVAYLNFSSRLSLVFIFLLSFSSCLAPLIQLGVF